LEVISKSESLWVGRLQNFLEKIIQLWINGNLGLHYFPGSNPWIIHKSHWQ
jgi:hypothetical protein